VLTHSNWSLEDTKVSKQHPQASEPAKSPRPGSPYPVPQVSEGSAGTAPVVLIAEDEEPIAEAVAWVVEDCGYTPLIARNGQEALELTRAWRPALVITDWMMPVLDGVSLIRTLKQRAALDGLRPIPTILMTAARRVPPQAAEADAFLPKPFDVDDLAALLRRFLEAPAH
jgi:two-component system response regulator VicR